MAKQATELASYLDAISEELGPTTRENSLARIGGQWCHIAWPFLLIGRIFLRGPPSQALVVHGARGQT